MIKIGLQDRAPDFPMSLHANEICEERKNFYGMFGLGLNIQNWPFLVSMGVA